MNYVSVSSVVPANSLKHVIVLSNNSSNIDELLDSCAKLSSGLAYNLSRGTQTSLLENWVNLGSKVCLIRLSEKVIWSLYDKIVSDSVKVSDSIDVHGVRAKEVESLKLLSNKQGTKTVVLNTVSYMDIVLNSVNRPLALSLGIHSWQTICNLLKHYSIDVTEKIDF
mgnify:CR=1 FL=1